MLDAYTKPCTVDRCQRDAEPCHYCCAQCAETMRARLREIEEYAAVLDARPGVGGDGGRRSPGFGSRPPARLDVIAARDYRTVSHVVGPDDVDDDIMSILGTLHGLSRWVWDERNRLAGPHDPVERPRTSPTITSEAGYLRGRIAWCAGQPWIDDLAENLRELHGQARRLAGEAPSKPVAPCGGCGGPLFPVGTTDTVAVRCGDCGGTYDGLELLDLGQRLAFEMMGAA
ncbi:hypothetical protein [Saccharopolyspora sp. NPDC002376]